MNKEFTAVLLFGLSTLLVMTCSSAESPNQQVITLSGPGATLTFHYAGDRLALTQIRRAGDAPLLYQDKETLQAGPGSVGNPLAVVIQPGCLGVPGFWLRP